VVVLHHMPGYDEATKRITRTFAAHGYAAVLPNLHWREAPGASPDAAAAAVRRPAACPTSGWSATSKAARGSCAPWSPPTARSA
jgi:dienelactone hydrolase